MSIDLPLLWSTHYYEVEKKVLNETLNSESTAFKTNEMRKNLFFMSILTEVTKFSTRIDFVTNFFQPNRTFSPEFFLTFWLTIFWFGSPLLQHQLDYDVYRPIHRWVLDTHCKVIEPILAFQNRMQYEAKCSYAYLWLYEWFDCKYVFPVYKNANQNRQNVWHLPRCL